MRTGLNQQFMERWYKYFPKVALPIAFYDSDNPELAKLFRIFTQHCTIEDLAQIRKGESLCCDTKSVSGFSGKQCLGSTQNQMPDIEYFLSCGIKGPAPPFQNLKIRNPLEAASQQPLGMHAVLWGYRREAQTPKKRIRPHNAGKRQPQKSTVLQ